MRFPKGKTKAVTLSYDDNNIASAKLADILSSYGLKCTFNLNSEKPTSTLKQADVEEHIIKNGHEVAVHGLNHRASGTLRTIEGIKDVLDCRLELESKYNTIIRGMAYPDTGITRYQPGTDYDSVKRYLKELDIAYARTLGGDNNQFLLPTDWYAWMPTVRNLNPRLMNFVDEFLDIDVNNLYNSVRYPRLFFMWGHASEFDQDNGWELLDNVCKKLTSKTDIWYATNIEIYNYVEAYKSLVFSADSSMVYNPSLYEIWFDIDRKLYSIKSGETIKIK